MTLDTLAHIGEALTIVAVSWKINRGFNRILDALESFPPHRHINGHITYPKGFSPPVQEDFPTAGTAHASQHSG